MPTDLADLQSVALLAGRAGDVDHTLGAALEALAEVVDYDLAAVLELDGDHLRVRCARGPLAGARVATHAIDLGHAPELRAALHGGRPRTFTEHEHDQAAGGEGDPYHGVVDLPNGHACLVAPLVAGGRTLGAMTFDRTVCQRYDEQTVALVTVYAQLVAMAMALALRNADLERQVRERLAAQQAAEQAARERLAPPPAPAPAPRVLSLEEAEREAIAIALEACGGKVYGADGAAARLGVPPSTLQHRMRRLGLNKPKR